MGVPNIRAWRPVSSSLPAKDTIRAATEAITRPGHSSPERTKQVESYRKKARARMLFRSLLPLFYEDV